MAIPDYQTLMLPLLELASNGKEHFMRDAVEALSNQFGLSEEERKLLLPSGKQTIQANRAGWARTYLVKAGLLESPKRGFIKITVRGREVLSNPPQKITAKYLKKFPEFAEFQTRKNNFAYRESETESEIINDQTPEELFASTYQQIRENLEYELLSLVKKCSPEFFERLVVELLVKMGYGGSMIDAGTAIGRSGDEGIDGIIKEDRLGLDVIYIQAKRWDSAAIGRPEIQKFAGALQGKRAKKGVFITTSSFSQEARDFVSNIESKIVLIDGDELARLMVDFNIGVSTVTSYEMKKIDSDYFSEE